MNNYSVVGKPVPRIDGIAKATGQAKYTFDLVLPGMLYGKILRSPHPHARILHIDTSRAERLPGVKAVITARDTLGKPYGNWRRFPELMDEYTLAVDKVRYIGEQVAALAAVDEDTAEEALDLIEVEYEPLPAVFDPREAMKDGAPLIHEGVKNNIRPAAVRHIEYGNVEQGFKESDYIREDRYYLQPVAHTAMEPHVALATSEPDGKLTIWTSTQTPSYIQWLLASTLGMKEGNIRVIKPYVGGAFGGKIELFACDFCSALLSKKSGRPVKIAYSRKEEFTTTRRKHPVFYEVKTGVTKDGTLVARQSKAILDAGAYVGMSPTACFLAGFFQVFPYRIPNFKYDGYPVYTNSSPTGAMRGFGGTQATTSSEFQMDRIAEDLGIDPAEIRLRNTVEPGWEIPDAKVTTCGFTECVQKVVEATSWKEKRGKLPYGRGVGLAGYSFLSGGVFNWIDTKFAFSAAVIRLNPDGTADLYVGSADVGQGSDTILAQIAAEELGIPMDDIRVIAADSALTPPDLGAWGSRQTLMTGNAVKAAAANAKKQLLEVAAVILKPNIIHELECKGGKVFVKARPERALSIAEVGEAALRAHDGQAIMGRGSYTPRGVGITTPAYSFGAQVAELEVDVETGKVKMINVTTAHDCGQAINPMQVAGQLEGSIAMGQGYALTEELISARGEIVNSSFRDYKIPTAVEVPPLDSILVETYEPLGPYGAKEAGEGLVNPVAGSIRNAIYDAVGVWMDELPITAEKLLRAIKATKEKKPEELRACTKV